MWDRERNECNIPYFLKSILIICEGNETCLCFWILKLGQDTNEEIQHDFLNIRFSSDVEVQVF